MALKDTWTPKIDDVDDVMASDINEVAAAVIKIEEEGVSGGGTGGGMTEEQVRKILAGEIDVGYLNIKGSPTSRINTPAIYISDGVPDWRGLVQYDENGTEITMEQTLAEKANMADVAKSLGIKADNMVRLNKVRCAAETPFVQFVATDDGTPYSELNLRKLYIFTQSGIKTAGADDTSTQLFLKFVGKDDYYTLTPGIGAAQITSDYKLSVMEIDLSRWNVYHGGGGCASGYGVNMQYATVLRGWSSTISTVIQTLTDPMCDGIQWQAATSGVNIPAGSRMEVWGCS